MLLLVTSLLLNWGTERRKFILITIGGYVLVLIATFAHFVPELMSITQSAFSATVDAELATRAKNWELLSLVRLGILFVLAVNLLFGLSKSSEPKLA